jgi:hypothetical protein
MSIQPWSDEIVVIVCIFLKELPTSFMDIQVQLFINSIEYIELDGVAHFHIFG